MNLNCEYNKRQMWFRIQWAVSWYLKINFQFESSVCHWAHAQHMMNKSCLVAILSIMRDCLPQHLVLPRQIYLSKYTALYISHCDFNNYHLSLQFSAVITTPATSERDMHGHVCLCTQCLPTHLLTLSSYLCSLQFNGNSPVTIVKCQFNWNFFHGLFSN